LGSRTCTKNGQRCDHDERDFLQWSSPHFRRDSSADWPGCAG
jgi:hypothetical protein